MKTKNLTDYYPVYLDVSELMKDRQTSPPFEYQNFETDNSPENPDPGQVAGGSFSIYKGKMLLDLALKSGLSAFQTILLLTKNSFEEHTFLKFNIRPDQLFCQGIVLFQGKPDRLILNFYENIAQYEPGLNQIWTNLKERYPDLADINFELVIHSLIVHHLIRFPVSIYSSVHIQSFTDQILMNQQAMSQRLNLVLLSERYIVEIELIEKVNEIYALRYKDFLTQLRMKEDVLFHYQKKLFLSHSPDINTCKELDDLMYTKLLEEKMSRNSLKAVKDFTEMNPYSETLIEKLRIREKIKMLYRSISKNCSEVHSSSDPDNNLSELTEIFLAANAIYIQPVSNLAEGLLQYMQMVILFSKAVIFRKTHGLIITGDHKLLSNIGCTEVLSFKDLKLLKKELDAEMVKGRLKSLTDFKIKFIMDEDLIRLHNHFLQKQIEHIDQQIVQIQSDINEILKMKSQASLFKNTNN